VFNCFTIYYLISFSEKCKLAEEVTCDIAPKCPDSDGVTYIPVPGNCVDYIMCVSGEEHPMQCAAGTEFSPEAQTCVLDANYECPYPRAAALAFLRRLFHF